MLSRLVDGSAGQSQTRHRGLKVLIKSIKWWLVAGQSNKKALRFRTNDVTSDLDDYGGQEDPEALQEVADDVDEGCPDVDVAMAKIFGLIYEVEDIVHEKTGQQKNSMKSLLNSMNPSLNLMKINRI